MREGKTKLKKLWEQQYKSEPTTRQPSPSPEPSKEKDWMEEVLESVAPVSRPKRATGGRRDQLFVYLEEPPVIASPLKYWRDHEAEWPQLASMAFDLLAIPAMSSECERVFSSCAKQTTPESSQLSGEMLWHQACLSNWQRRGAIEISLAFNAMALA